MCIQQAFWQAAEAECKRDIISHILALNSRYTCSMLVYSIWNTCGFSTRYNGSKQISDYCL